MGYKLSTINKALWLLFIVTTMLVNYGQTASTRYPKKGGGVKSSTISTTERPSTTSTTTGYPIICSEGVRAHRNSHRDNGAGNMNASGSDAGVDIPVPSTLDENLVQWIDGDVFITIITRDPITAMFVVNRINQMNLISSSFDIGVRAIEIREPELLESILVQEVEYLNDCVTYPLGIFIDKELYQNVEHLIDDLGYHIWPLPSSRALLFQKAVSLLYSMPWTNRTASVEILAESPDDYNEFMQAAKNQRLCLTYFRTIDNIYIVVGNKLVANFKENGTIFAIPTGRTDNSFMADLPGNSYVLMESEVELQQLVDNNTHHPLDHQLVGKNILSSELLAMGGPLLHFTAWLNSSLHEHCNKTQGVFDLELCGPDFMNFVEDWKTDQHVFSPKNVTESLKLRNLEHFMTFQMFQKVVIGAKDSEDFVKLHPIAMLNFLSNVHNMVYNILEGEATGHEMKHKFGQVFTCLYADGTNRRYPFYFEGESVMYWRLKPDAWVAAGLTASVLGIIVCVAILVFIAVRITIGDVFEGNPLSTIMLLLSLIVLFASFVPFAMEYISDHLNAQVTFDDAETMNTLCAVRIFLVTLCYCLTFSLLLSRALMLASIGSEGGFLSHVNGYIQSVICLFSTLVQIGLSTQLLIVMHIANENISCDNLYYGHWLWGLLIYDFLLMLFTVILTPLIVRSQRNYKEGILLVVGSILILIIWLVWIPMSVLGNEWRDAALPLGAQATGWAILAGIMIPRSFLIVRGIERSDIAQALPSLTSLALAQNQYASEQSVYECVNPAMRHCSSREDGMCEVGHHNMQSPSEMPTLPLRGSSGGRRQLFFSNLRNNNNTTNVRRSYASSQSSLPPSPNKVTRF